MSLDVQGTFVSEKIAKVRWVMDGYQESGTFVTGGWDNDTNLVRVWKTDEPESEEAVKEVASVPVGGDVSGMRVVQDGCLVTTSDGDARLLSLPHLQTTRAWERLHYFKDGTPSPCTDFALLNGDFVTVGEDGRMNFLTIYQTKVVRTIEDADSCSLHCVCFLKHNEVITGNMRGHMKIWDLRSQSDAPAASFLLGGEQVTATCVVHHPTQWHLVLAGSESGSLAVWDLRVNTYPASLLNAHSAAVGEIQFHPDHPERLFTCSMSGEIWHWNTAKMSKQNAGPSLMNKTANESTTNPWLMNDKDHSDLEVTSLMSDLHKSINTLDCNKNKVVCGCDNEAVYIISNVFT